MITSEYIRQDFEKKINIGTGVLGLTHKKKFTAILLYEFFFLSIQQDEASKRQVQNILNICPIFLIIRILNI